MTPSRHLTISPGVAPSAASEPVGERRQLTPVELSEWLSDRASKLAHRWLLELRARTDRDEEGTAELLAEFLGLFTEFLAPAVGPHREQVEPLLQQAAELYGNVGAWRGLAAGEAVEEFQILREVLFRLLYEDPPVSGRATLEMREFVQLNRWIDLGVTYASIGHTDTLFFNLFQGHGVSEGPTPALRAEAREQLATIREEHSRIVTFRPSAGEGVAS